MLTDNKRRIAAILLIIMLFTCFFSCSQNTVNPQSDTDIINETNDLTENTTEILRENMPDTLPEDLVFNGEQYTVLSRNEFTWAIEMGVDELNGEIINDAIFNRNKQVEDRLNVKINVVKIPGIWGAEESFNQAVRENVISGDNVYDLIAGYMYFISPLASEGLFTNLNNIPYLDFNQPWWSASLAKEITIDNKLFFMTGDLSLTFIVQLMVLYVNKTLQKDLNIQDIYELVFDQKWTYDIMFDMVKGVNSDLNGDGKYDENDMYGLGFEIGNYCNAFFMGNDQPITVKGSDGYPEFALNTPKTIDIFERMYELLFNNIGVYAHSETQERLTRSMFINGQLLLDAGLIDNASYCRDMKDDFGIIPFPKYDESQEKYCSVSQDAFSLFSIPVTNKRPELAGAVTEALASESYRKVIPSYYEISLKIKYSRDNQTAQTLDIIRDGAILDFGFVNSCSLNNILTIFRDLPNNKSSDFASYYAKNEKLYQQGLDNLIAAYKELK
jgi:hypothetical protein